MCACPEGVLLKAILTCGWVNLKIEEKKEWKRNEIMGGTSLFVRMILSLVSLQCFWIDLYMQQGSFVLDDM